ncbi:MAG TPA: hypothetical protein VJU82_16505 [Acidobacteriaceae bacterium]|nr:hypothetical protein [Acidobacteriaceae bacterium]
MAYPLSSPKVFFLATDIGVVTEFDGALAPYLPTATTVYVAGSLRWGAASVNSGVVSPVPTSFGFGVCAVERLTP